MSLDNPLENNTPIIKAQKLLLLLCALYVTIDILSDLLSHRLVAFGNIIIIASAFTYPLTYLVNDVVAEIFGIRMGKTIIWIGLLVDFIFVGVLFAVLPLPTPHVTNINQAYSEITHSLSRLTIGATLGVIAARFTNIYILIRYKILMKGRFFLFRSIFACSIGIIIHSLITVTTVYYGTVPLEELISILSTNIGTDLFTSVCLAWISALAVVIIKKYLNITFLESKVTFNPFRI